MKKVYKLLSVLVLISTGISQIKVNVNDLVKHGDKYFKENQYIPYDGIVFDISKQTGNKTLQFKMIGGFKNGSHKEWYDNGTPKTIGEYLNNDSTDLWTMWHGNGMKGSEGTYKNNNRDGLFYRWYKNGQKEFEGSYKDGKKDGLWAKWYGNGQKKLKIHYKNNQLNGKYLYWHENGQKEFEGTYKDGKKDGLWTKWYRNGQKEIESFFQDGRERGLVTEWYEDGLTREERTFKQVLTYTEEGLKKKRKTYKKLFTYYNTGNIKREKNYRNGKEWGLEILYHDNGNIKYKDVEFKKNGDDNTYFIFTVYDKYGKLIEGDETLWDGFEIKSGECYKDNEEVDCYVPN